MKSIIFTLASLMLIGCAPQKSLTIYTNPAGATLYQQDGAAYTAPVTVYYDMESAQFDTWGCLLAQPFTVVWSSGAQIDGGSAPLKLCHEHSTLTFDRPDVDGLARIIRE